MIAKIINFNTPPEDTCSFCGVKKSNTAILIGNENNTRFICNVCVQRAKRRMAEQEAS